MRKNETFILSVEAIAFALVFIAAVFHCDALMLIGNIVALACGVTALMMWRRRDER